MLGLEGFRVSVTMVLTVLLAFTLPGTGFLGYGTTI